MCRTWNSLKMFDDGLNKSLISSKAKWSWGKIRKKLFVQGALMSKLKTPWLVEILRKKNKITLGDISLSLFQSTYLQLSWSTSQKLLKVIVLNGLETSHLIWIEYQVTGFCLIGPKKIYGTNERLETLLKRVDKKIDENIQIIRWDSHLKH